MSCKENTNTPAKPKALWTLKKVFKMIRANCLQIGQWWTDFAQNVIFGHIFVTIWSQKGEKNHTDELQNILRQAPWKIVLKKF